jgi:SAM-dependent methyltransferase
VADEPRRLADTFDSVAELYQRARPTYPPELFADLARLGGLTDDTRVVEIGCGTGQATRHLAERGWAVTCVEPGQELARVARRELARYPRVRIEVERFESWMSGDQFDLVFAATSWHWLDPKVAYRHAADLLRPGGCLAIVTTDHVFPDDGDHFFVDVQHVYRAIGEADGESDRPPAPGDVPHPLIHEITATGIFRPPDTRSYLSSITYTADEFVDVLSTYSNHIAMREDDRAYLFEHVRALIESQPQGIITKHYLHTLYVAPRHVGERQS